MRYEPEHKTRTRGFYKHFRSRELFAEAIAQAFSDSEKIYSSLQNARHRLPCCGAGA